MFGNVKKKIKDKGANTNRALAAICIGSVAFLFFIMSGSMFVLRRQMDQTQGLQKDGQEEYNAYYVLIPSNHDAAFWKAVYKSARERGKENRIYVEMAGNNLSADYSQEELMRIAIFSGVDGIILEADESPGMTEYIREAEDKGIPVVTVLGDNSQSGRKSFVGVNNYNLGREYGRQVLKIKDRQVREVLVCMSANARDVSQNIIFSGIQETLEKEGGDFINVTAAAIESRGAFAVEESVRNLFLEAASLPDVFICLDEISTTSAYQAVVDYNMVGQVDIIGYYDSETILKAVERKVICSTISIDTEEMGRFCVDALNEYCTTGYVNDYYVVDTNLIDASNVREYMGGE